MDFDGFFPDVSHICLDIATLQYGELIQLQNVQLPVEHDISSRNGIVILPYDTTSATPLPVQL
jgi:hypothetical protein